MAYDKYVDINLIPTQLNNKTAVGNTTRAMYRNYIVIIFSVLP